VGFNLTQEAATDHLQGLDHVPQAAAPLEVGNLTVALRREDRPGRITTIIISILTVMVQTRELCSLENQAKSSVQWAIGRGARYLDLEMSS